MGRVSKHRKIKSHDPFYRGPRRDRKGLVDLCPGNEDDQPVPKSLVRLMRRAESIKKTKKKKKSGGEKTCSAEVSGSTEQKAPGDGKREGRGRGEGEAAEGPMFSKRKGESLKSYLERVDMEANTRIMEAFRKNRKPSERRKRRLEERWRRSVARRKGRNQNGKMDVELRDEVKFGEVVQAPPQLKVKPRGSQPSTPFPSKPLLLQQTMAATQKPPHTIRPTPSRAPVVGLKRKRDLEMEREHVISVYRQKKKTAIGQFCNVDIVSQNFQ